MPTLSSIFRRRKKKRVPFERLKFDERVKRGRVFGGKKFNFDFFVPDPQHQGKPGMIDTVRRTFKARGLLVRTERLDTGWNVFSRRRPRRLRR